MDESSVTDSSYHWVLKPLKRIKYKLVSQARNQLSIRHSCTIVLSPVLHGTLSFLKITSLLQICFICADEKCFPTFYFPRWLCIEEVP